MLAGIGHNGCLLQYRCHPVHNGLTGDQNESGDPGRPVAPATHYRRIIPSAVVRCTPNPTPSEALEIVMTPRSWFACAAATVMGIVTPAGAAPPAASAHHSMAGLHADTRISLPLRPALARHQKQNMREHLEAVQAIVAGLATGDFTAIETAASRMGYSRETATQCEHMGADAPGFAERAIAFHKSADEIAAAARRKDIQDVTANLSRTLVQCTGCHATYRQDIIGKRSHDRLVEPFIGSHH